MSERSGTSKVHVGRASVGLVADLGLRAVSSEPTGGINIVNPTVGCHYILPCPRLPFPLYGIIALDHGRRQDFFSGVGKLVWGTKVTQRVPGMQPCWRYGG